MNLRVAARAFDAERTGNQGRSGSAAGRLGGPTNPRGLQDGTLSPLLPRRRGSIESRCSDRQFVSRHSAEPFHTQRAVTFRGITWGTLHSDMKRMQERTTGARKKGGTESAAGARVLLQFRGEFTSRQSEVVFLH